MTSNFYFWMSIACLIAYAVFTVLGGDATKYILGSWIFFVGYGVLARLESIQETLNQRENTGDE